MGESRTFFFFDNLESVTIIIALAPLLSPCLYLILLLCLCLYLRVCIGRVEKFFQPNPLWWFKKNPTQPITNTNTINPMPTHKHRYRDREKEKEKEKRERCILNFRMLHCWKLGKTSQVASNIQLWRHFVLFRFLFGGSFKTFWISFPSNRFLIKIFIKNKKLVTNCWFSWVFYFLYFVLFFYAVFLYFHI